MRLRTTVLALVVLIAGCAEDSRGVGMEVVRADSAGIEIVSNVGDDALLEMRFREVAVLEGGGGIEFFRLRPQGLAVGPGGELVVLDQGNVRVAVFDEQFEWSHDLGREGSGPGEFRFPSTITVDDAGVARVFDTGRGAEIRFSLDGDFLPEASIPGGFSGGRVRMHDSATFYARVLEGGTQWDLTRDDDGQLSTEINVELPSPASVEYTSCGLLMSLPPLLTQRPIWDANDETMAFARVEAYNVTVSSTEGTIRVIRRDVEPVQATEALAREHLGEGERWVMGITEECTVPSNEAIEQRGIAEHLPLVTGLALTPDNELWIRRFKLGGGDGAIDVFSADGAYRGSLPEGSPWPDLFLSSERVAAIEEDELGVERIVIYEIEG